MYSEKIWSFIDRYYDDRVIIIDTMFVEYLVNKEKHFVIRLKENDIVKLFDVLKQFNDIFVIFDNPIFWFKNYDEAGKFFDELRKISITNNLIIFT